MHIRLQIVQGAENVPGEVMVHLDHIISVAENDKGVVFVNTTGKSYRSAKSYREQTLQLERAEQMRRHGGGKAYS